MPKKLNHLINKIEIILGRSKLISYPINAQIEPTNRCNQRCLMCPRNDKLDVPIGDLSFENFKKILNQLASLKGLLLNGLGEPLLNKELPRMIAYANQKNIKVAINSNCTLIDKNLANQLVASRLDLIKISMDSADPQVYQSIRGMDIQPAIKGIQNLVKVKKEKKSARPSLWFNPIIMKNNYQQLIDILRLAQDLEIDLVRFKPLNIWDIKNNKKLRVTPNQLKASIQKTIQQTKSLKISHNLNKILDDFEIYNRPQKNLPCYSPWTEVYVQYYGGVRLCCEFYSQQHDIGNMLKENFKKIWNSHKMQKIRQEFKKGNTYFSVCQNCNRFQKNIVIQEKINKIKKINF